MNIVYVYTERVRAYRDVIKLADKSRSVPGSGFHNIPRKTRNEHHVEKMTPFAMVQMIKY